MTDPHEAPNGAHGWRISLNLTRRVVRRMMELDDAAATPRPLRPCVSQVPKAADFAASVRLLRRTIRRTITQSQLIQGQPA